MNKQIAKLKNALCISSATLNNSISVLKLIITVVNKTCNCCIIFCEIKSWEYEWNFAV